jgi:hypothetical protein
MYLAKHWRNKRLRYRLMRMTKRHGIDRVLTDMKPREDTKGDNLAVVNRVKVLS